MTPTDAQLRTLARWLARTWVETERGLRSPHQLQPLLTRLAYTRLQQLPPHQRATPGAVLLPEDVRTVSLQRDGPGRARAVALVRSADRWQALYLELRQQQRSWRIHDIARPHHLEPDPPPQPSDPAESLHRLQDTHRHAEAAAQAADRAHRGKPTSPRRQAEATHWRQLVADLNRKIADLQRRLELADRALLSTETPPEWATGTLGPRPHDPHHQQAWIDAAVAVATYRRRWGLTTDPRPLGPTPSHPNQTADLNDLFHLIDRLGLPTPQPDIFSF